MLTPLLLLANALQDPLYPCRRLEPLEGAQGMVDFNLDGFDDLYSWRSVLLSDGSFGGQVLDPATNEPVAVVDLNGDGHPDLADGDVVALFDPGTQSFAAVPWEAVLPEVNVVAGGDVDGDGNADLFKAWVGYTVQLGDGAGGTSGHVDGDIATLSHACLGDLNGDGLDDLIACFLSGAGLIVARATGGGSLSAPATISSEACLSSACVDLDADGDLDVVTVTPQEVLTFQNNGAGILLAGDAATLPWLGDQLHVVDFDGSGTLDAVVGSSWFSSEHELLVAHGDGAGGFAGTEVLDLAIGQRSFAVGDPDGDGDVDVAVHTSYNHLGTDQDAVVFFERDGGLVAPVQLVDLPVKAAYDSMLIGDADEDGDHDLLIVHGSYDEQAELELGLNDGAGALSFISGPSILPLVGRVVLGDVASDGTTDLLGFPSVGSGVTLHPGSGGGSFGPPMLLPLEGNAQRGLFADWSSDGFPDLLTLSVPFGTTLYLYTGGASYSFGAPLLSSTLVGNRDVEPADLDLDGDLDVMILGPSVLATVAGNGAGSFTQTTSTPLTLFLPGQANGFDLGDFDADGLTDALLTDGSWYRGVGGGQTAFAGRPYVPLYVDQYGAVRDVVAADLDGDGTDDAIIDDGAVLLGGPSGPAYDRSYYSSSMLSVAVGNLTGNGVRDVVVQDFDAGYVLLPALSGCLGELTPYGAGCMGSTGLVPALAGSGCPTPAGSFALDVSGGLPSTVSYASFGLGQGSIPLPNGCTLLLNPWLQIFVGFTLDASGEGSLPIAVSPESPVGFTVTSQVGLFDPGAPGFFTLTNGLAITVR